MTQTTTAPGNVNAHTHVYSALAPYGMPEPAQKPENFVQILERIWWKLDRALDEASLRASARLYAAESLLAGTTVLVDHHESPEFIEGSLDVIADACEEIGIRAVLCYGATERNGGKAEGSLGLAECRRFARANQRPGVRPRVGLHASFTVSDDTLRAAAALCGELGLPMHTHMAEDRADVTDARNRGYSGPLERLSRLGALPPGSILAHGVHFTEGQVRHTASLGSWLVQNPRSNEGNNVGYAHMLWASQRVALGTDGYPADMTAELAALERLATKHLDVSGPQGPARRLANGRALAAERFSGPEAVEDSVRREEGQVRDVQVGGRDVVRDGKLLTADIEEIRAHAREQAKRLWPRMEALT